MCSPMPSSSVILLIRDGNTEILTYFDCLSQGLLNTGWARILYKNAESTNKVLSCAGSALASRYLGVLWMTVF